MLLHQNNSEQEKKNMQDLEELQDLYLTEEEEYNTKEYILDSQNFFDIFNTFSE